MTTFGANLMMIGGDSGWNPPQTPPSYATGASTFEAGNPSGVIGRALPAVVGTGEVDGLWFIGGAVQTLKSTSVSVTETETDWAKAYKQLYPSVGTATGSGYTISSGSYMPQDYFTETTVTYTPVYETTQVAGYLLAYDYFERGYDLIRLEVDGELVYDAENGIGASSSFRFYGGQQTDADDLVADILGSDARAYQNHVMVFLPDYPADNPPSVRAVISNAASSSGAAEAITWKGEQPSTIFQLSAAGASSYDPATGILYYMPSNTSIAGITSIPLIAIDINTKEELYRVNLEGTAAYVSNIPQDAMSLGADFIFANMRVGVSSDLHGVWDVSTGELVASFAGPTSTNNFWFVSTQFDGKWHLVGVEGGGNQALVHAVFDPSPPSGTPTFTYAEDVIDGIMISALTMVPGRKTSGTFSVFVEKTNNAVYELTWDGEQWTETLLYTPNDSSYFVHYDSSTGYLVVHTSDTTVSPTAYEFQYINPTTGALVDTVTASQLFNSPQHNQLGGFFPKPGYMILKPNSGATPGKLYILDIRSKTIAEFYSDASLTPNELSSDFWDQGSGLRITGYNSNTWTIEPLPSTRPGEVALSSVLTDICALAGYSSGDLSFDGFSGLTTYGGPIYSDVSSRNLINGIADLFGFWWGDVGTGINFKKPGTDGSLTIDAAIASADLIEKGQGITTRDDADLKVPSEVQLTYVSKDSGYQVRQASFSMPTGVTESARTLKIDTFLVMTDEDAQRFVQEKFLDAQKRRRDHSFVTVADHAELEFGDIITVPSGDVTFTAAVEEWALNPSDMTVEISARDFQTEVSTTVTAVSNAYNVTVVSLLSQYIHLDVPLLSYGDDLGGSGLRQYGMLAQRGLTNWGGALLYRSGVKTGINLVSDQGPHGGVIGVCEAALAAPNDPFSADYLNSVTIRVTSGLGSNLSSATASQVLTGTNGAFIGKPGRWEWVGYETVTDNGDGSYTISGFTYRGNRGTEVYADRHQAGDLFVTIGTDWVRGLVHPLTDLDATLYYRAVGTGSDPSRATAYAYTVPGAAEMPYAVVNLAGAVNGSDSVVTWDYRNRVAAWEMFSASPDSGEDELKFEIDVLGGSPEAVLSTYTVTDAIDWTYTSAQKTTDFGTPPADCTINVYMISGAVGRGHLASATIPL